ncbi:FAD/NAD(P)-binding domain-containing protein [Thozetella sp. PMI_491]|nr:FAD/NAD(P)-binding domain-containing protein [Thozetella sp. PMI_491]
MASQELHVIIVGASITGITLALCLERLNVSYTVLEKHNDIGPRIGGSLAINPNGALILEQLDVWSEVNKAMYAFEEIKMRIADDFSYTLKYAADLRNMLGYSIGMISRHKLINILYGQIRHKDRFITGCQVERISDEGEAHVCVFDSKGREHQGGLVVGADGIRSQVRSQLSPRTLKAAAAAGAEPLVTCEYACVFGTSANLPKFTPGLRIRSDKGLTLFAESLKGSDVFWMAFTKLDQRRQWPHKMKFTKEDALDIAQKILDKKFDDDLCFRDAWQTADSFDIVPLEEGVFSQWVSGRLVCIGDAVHKVCPNTGQGANMAMEDAAGIANLVSRLLAQASTDSKNWIDRIELEKELQQFERVHKARARKWDNLSRWVLRMHAHDGFLRRLVNSYAMPAMDPWLARMSCGLLLTGVTLDFVEKPALLASKGKGQRKDNAFGEADVFKFVLRFMVAIYLLSYAYRTVVRNFEIPLIEV